MTPRSPSHELVARGAGLRVIRIELGHQAPDRLADGFAVHIQPAPRPCQFLLKAALRLSRELLSQRATGRLFTPLVATRTTPEELPPLRAPYGDAVDAVEHVHEQASLPGEAGPIPQRGAGREGVQP